MTATVDLTNFNKGIAALRRAVPVASRVIVEKESGEVIKTLVRISPPENPRQTKENIKFNINRNFESIGRQNNFDSMNNKIGPSGIKWYAANSDFLFGGAPDSDLRSASENTLLQVHYRTKKIQGSRRIVVPFRKQRGGQKVALITKVITSPEQRASLIKRIQGHVGRLKAAWMVAVTKGKIRISGGHQPPNWVKKHAPGARGRFENNLMNKEFPSFTIVNFAKGVTSRSSKYFMKTALKIRAGAMLKNAHLHFVGKKNLSDYAKGTVTPRLV